MIITFFSIIIFEIQAAVMIVVRPKVSHILLNSNNSEVLPKKMRGIRKKRR